MGTVAQLGVFQASGWGLIPPSWRFLGAVADEAPGRAQGLGLGLNPGVWDLPELSVGSQLVMELRIGIGVKSWGAGAS